jgi:imidazolonepropionase
MPKQEADLVIRNIGQIVTVAGFSDTAAVRPNVDSLGVMEASADDPISLASKDGVIRFIGKHSDLGQSVSTTSASEIDAKSSLVLPGFVDAHTHAVFAGERERELEMKLAGLTYMEILSRGGGILRTVEATRKASKDQLVEETSNRLDSMISNGTTTFELKTGYGLNLESEITLLETIDALRTRFDVSPTLLSAHAIPPEFSGNSEGYVKEVVLPSINIASNRKLASFFDVFLEEGVFDRDESRLMLEYAAKRNLQTKLHADEFTNQDGAALAAELKTISADHLLCTTDEGFEKLAQSKVVGVLLPGTSLTSFARYARAREMIQLGIPIALATDLSPNSWIESMQFVISLACYCLRMTPAEAIVGTTINGAHAIKRADELGSLEVGKKCDLLITRLKNYQQIGYRISGNYVRTVVKKGKVVRVLEA